MAITEFVIPHFKQDAETHAAFEPVIKAGLSTAFIEATGLELQVWGRIISENSVNVEADFRPAVGTSWDTAENFNTFLTSDAFKGFAGKIMPYATAAPNPLLFETDVAPTQVFDSTLTEAWMVRIGNEEKAGVAWKEFVAAIGDVKAGHSFSGLSLNQEEKLFVGAVGWESYEARSKVLEDVGVFKAKAGLDELVSYTFLTEFARSS